MRLQTRYQLDRLKLRQLGRFEETPLRQGHPVIDEVPVARADQTDVRLENDRSPTGAKQLADDAQLIDHGIAGFKVLEVVAHEDRPEMAIRDRLGKVKAGSLDETDVLGQRRFHVTDVRCPSLGRVDEPDEMPAITGQVEDGCRPIDVSPEEADDL